MLIVLVPVIWLAVVALLVAVCRSAARGDDALERASGTRVRTPVPSRTRYQPGAEVPLLLLRRAGDGAGPPIPRWPRPMPIRLAGARGRQWPPAALRVD